MPRERTISPLFILVAIIAVVAALYFAKAYLLPIGAGRAADLPAHSAGQPHRTLGAASCSNGHPGRRHFVRRARGFGLDRDGSAHSSESRAAGVQRQSCRQRDQQSSFDYAQLAHIRRGHRDARKGRARLWSTKTKPHAIRTTRPMARKRPRRPNATPKNRNNEPTTCRPARRPRRNHHSICRHPPERPPHLVRRPTQWRYVSSRCRRRP